MKNTHKSQCRVFGAIDTTIPPNHRSYMFAGYNPQTWGLKPHPTDILVRFQLGRRPQFNCTASSASRRSTMSCDLQDGSFELDSRYGCTEPFGSSPDDSCGVFYELSTSSDEKSTIASVKIGGETCGTIFVALHLL